MQRRASDQTDYAAKNKHIDYYYAAKNERPNRHSMKSHFDLHVVKVDDSFNFDKSISHIKHIAHFSFDTF
jgi:hypothetical protein